MQQLGLWIKQSVHWRGLLTPRVTWTLARSLIYTHKYAKELIELKK